MRAFFDSTLNTYSGEIKSVSDLIVVKSLRLRKELNFYIIILRQLKCSALHFRCEKVNYLKCWSISKFMILKEFSREKIKSQSETSEQKT